MSGPIEDIDVMIIGGGPAGLSAALWCHDLGLKALVLERSSELGGQLLWTYNPITNYLGLRAKNGRELRRSFLDHLSGTGVVFETGTTIESADLKNKSVSLADGRRVSARVLIIATGVSRRKLGVPGEAELAGKGVLDSGVNSKEQVKDRSVVIVGGGDAALENAVILSDYAKNVTLVHRGVEFRARREFIEAIESRDNIDMRLESQLLSIAGENQVQFVDIESTRTADRMRLPADAVLVRIGVSPNTDIFRGQIELDQEGYIVVDAAGATSKHGIFAVGDVANPLSPTISTAAGTGATAAKAARALIIRLFGA